MTCWAAASSACSISTAISLSPAIRMSTSPAPRREGRFCSATKGGRTVAEVAQPEPCRPAQGPVRRRWSRLVANRTAVEFGHDGPAPGYAGERGLCRPHHPGAVREDRHTYAGAVRPPGGAVVRQFQHLLDFQEKGLCASQDIRILPARSRAVRSADG